MYRLRLIPSTPIIRTLPPRNTPIRIVASGHRQYQSRPEVNSPYSLHPQKKHTCPSCHKLLPTSLPACTTQGCNYIQPPPKDLTRDYFALFGLPGLPKKGEDAKGDTNARNAFHIDPKLLRDRFLRIQKVSHPDRWARHGEEATEAAVSQSALATKAYQTLLSPRLRGEYILSLNGVYINEADTMEQEQELIMGVMEAREELEEAEGEEVQKLLTQNEERMEKLTMELENAIANEDWPEAKRLVIQLKYWESFRRAGEGRDVDH
ncbi:Co-chaperone Hsc20 [Serendipita vermifera]|nr:Co-chaperone Hsc20 [Serendipita vermifera]